MHKLNDMNLEIFYVYTYTHAYLIVEKPQFYNDVDLNCRLTVYVLQSL